ncbi:MAG: methionyl-tRNA formyltransferase [Candidatus Moranbacteria bacterium]|nr:methionyl-tRNA formyltransferase [Candidatus Moranbacteria bacterium]
MHMQPRIIFMGTSTFAIPALKELIRRKNKYRIIAVYTQPDKAQNRGLKMNCCPVKNFLKNKGLKIKEPEKINSKKELEKFQKLKPDLVIVAAYGKFIPKDFLSIPQFGFINIHPSLLPEYRGPSPIQTAILHQNSKTGTTIIKLNEEMDAGDILTQKEVPIDPKDDFPSLSQKLAEKSAKLLIETLPRYLNGSLKPKPQNNNQATYTKIINKKDGLINFQKETAAQILAKFKAFKPWPNTYFYYKSKKNNELKIDLISISINDLITKEKAGIVQLDKKISKYPFITTKKGIVIIKKIKPAGKSIMRSLEFINGRPDFIESRIQ